MRAWICLLGIVFFGCGSSTAGTGTASGGSSGSSGAGATCGGATCAAGELCVEPCQGMSCGGDSGTPCSAPFCWAPPSSCAAAPTCACVTSADPCFTMNETSLGVCATIAGGKLTCGACD